MKRCEAPECDVDFTPQRSTGRYCSATCRQRAGRARKAAASSVEADAAAGKAEHALVRAVRKELRDASALDTVAGQLALQFARRLVDPDGASLSALSKELRTLLAEAKGSAGAPAAGPSTGAVAAAEDEVDQARQRREEKAAAAAAAGAAGESS